MTEPFTFLVSTRIVWRSPAAEALVEEVESTGARRVLVVSDPGVAAAGLVEEVTSPLIESGVELTVHAEVAGNPTTRDVADTRRLAEDGEVEAIIAVGGGSAIDTAKATAMLITNGGEYSEYQWEGRKITTRGHPFIAIPTTAGTGSEVSKVAVISDESQPFKKGVVSPQMFAHVAILDPGLTVGLPAVVTAATGIDALVHALEAYTGRRTNPLSDTLALESLHRARTSLLRATRDGSDLEARADMMLAALLGGMAMDQAGLGLVHALSGGICSHLHLHHGTANALILPYAAEFNAGFIAPDRQARLNDVLGLPSHAPEGAMAERLRDLVVALGLPVGLAGLGADLTGVDWGAVADESMRMVMMANNPRPVTLDDCHEILAAMR
jgi:alcohol dehydrogenase class IV